MAKDTAKDTAGRGSTKIQRDFGRDDSSLDTPMSKGGKLGGSTTNLSHSISSTAKQK